MQYPDNYERQNILIYGIKALPCVNHSQFSEKPINAAAEIYYFAILLQYCRHEI
jgi:hypothetical protein